MQDILTQPIKVESDEYKVTTDMIDEVDRILKRLGGEEERLPNIVSQPKSQLRTFPDAVLKPKKVKAQTGKSSKSQISSQLQTVLIDSFQRLIITDPAQYISLAGRISIDSSRSDSKLTRYLAEKNQAIIEAQLGIKDNEIDPNYIDTLRCIFSHLSAGIMGNLDRNLSRLIESNLPEDVDVDTLVKGVSAKEELLEALSKQIDLVWVLDQSPSPRIESLIRLKKEIQSRYPNIDLETIKKIISHHFTR